MPRDQDSAGGSEAGAAFAVCCLKLPQGFNVQAALETTELTN